MNVSLLISIFLFGLLFLVGLIRYAHVLRLLDIPNERSMHKHAIPRTGGIAIFLSIAIANLLFNYSFVASHIPLVTALILIFGLGLLDDIRNTSPRIKFFIIILASLLLLYKGMYITHLSTQFGYSIDLPLAIAIPFTIISMVGITNSINLIDGLDGLAGSVSLVMFLAFLAVGINYNDDLITILSLSFIMGILSFLVFNWNPAKIFMGDSGSLTLGFVLAILSVQSTHYISPFSIIFIVALPILDTLIVMTRRIQRRQSPFKADKNHIHHFMVNMKGDVRFSVLLLISIQAIFSIVGYQMRESNDTLSMILFFLLFFTFINLFDQRIRRRNHLHKHRKRHQ